MRISWKKSKYKLATVWFGSSGVLFIVIILQTIFGAFGENSKEAWSWFLPQVIPSLSLIIGVLVMDTLGKGAKIRTADKFMFTLSFALSLVYLLAVSVPIFLRPFTELAPIEIMQQSNLWLTPLQGLVSISLGAFFIQSST